MSAERLRCLSCERLIEPGACYCAHCGGAPLGQDGTSDWALVAGPVASMRFREQAGQLLARHVAGASAAQIAAKLSARTPLVVGIDPEVGRALVERLKEIPAEAQLVPTRELKASLLRRALGPLPLALLAAGVLGAVALSPWLLVIGVGLAGGAAALASGATPQPLLEVPALPPPPRGSRALLALRGAAEPEVAQDIEAVAAGAFALLEAAHRSGLPVSAAKVEGVGADVDDVVSESAELGQRARDGDAAARERLRQIAAAVRRAVEALGPAALPERAEQRLLQSAEVVKEITETTR